MKYSLFLFLIITFLYSISIMSAASIDLKINAAASDFDTDLYLQTDSDSSTIFDYQDFEQRTFPNGNYSFLFSNIGGKNLTIDVWPPVERTFYLIYQISPSYSGTLSLSWSTSGISSDLTATLTDYGSDSSYSSSVDSANMKTSSSYTTSMTGTRRYFKIQVSNYTSGDTSGGGGGGGGGTESTCVSTGCPLASSFSCGTSYTDNCGNSCGTGDFCSSGSCTSGTCVTCTPLCEIASTVDCGVALTSTNGCDQPCSGTGTKCASGVCTDGVCVSCNENWTCSTWSSCINGFQQRTCSDTSACGTFTTKPVEYQACIIPSCTSNSDCISSDSCSVGTCNPISGKCQYDYTTSSCDDGNLCTIEDKCSFGSCSGTTKICDSGKVCQNGVCVLGEEPKIIPEEVTNLISTRPDCSSNFSCGAWSECSSKYGVSNLIDFSEVSLTQERTCISQDDCKITFSESKKCAPKEFVSVRNKEWCGQNYTEVLNNQGVVVARIKTLDNGKSVSVNLNTGETYCAYCYNGKKDYDEADVDCGGSCPVCIDGKPRVMKSIYQSDFFGLIMALISLLIFMLSSFYISRGIVDTLKGRTGIARSLSDNIQYFRRKYSAWKKEGYNVTVLNQAKKTLSENK
jgi:hypothetical protein